MTTIIGVVMNVVLAMLFVGILIWVLPIVIHDIRDSLLSALQCINGRRGAQARAARDIEEINRKSNETITRLQHGYWEAQQRMRQELDRDE